MNPLSRPLHPRTKLALLSTLRKQKGLARGFTLIELMITVAIVGILSAVALPQFLGARTAAAAGAAVGQGIGLAKECAVYVASGGVGEQPSVSFGVCSTAGGTYSATWGGQSAAGIRCLGAGVTFGAIIRISSTGQLSCTPS